MRPILTTTIALLAACAAALPAVAQTGAGEKKAPSAKPAAASRAGANPGLARSAQKAVEEVTPIDDDPAITVTEKDLEVASQVHVGEMKCELGAAVKVTPARRTGLFVVTTKGHRFLMHPVDSRTGAIRLEDGKRGAMWLQLGNKSMLMSQKLGQRLADECQSPQQVTFAEELKRNPRPSILDAPQPAASAPAAAAPAALTPSAGASAPEAAPASGAQPNAPAAAAPATSAAPASAPRTN